MNFKINRVYTRSGDRGETSLIGGKRVSKAHSRVCCCGELDELNCYLGLIREKLSPELRELDPVLEELQQELFDVGVELATPSEERSSLALAVNKEQVLRLEKLCDQFNADLPELSSFILPASSESSVFLHLARSVCRRVERQAVLVLNSEGPAALSDQLIAYLNRLSDLLFILARYVLRRQAKVPSLWIPAARRRNS